MRMNWVALPLVLLSGAAATRAEAQDSIATAEVSVGTGVVERELQGAAETFPTTVGRVYGFVRVANTHPGSEIEVVWYHGDVEVGRITLPIGGSPWRTWSSKVIPPEATGDWRVEVLQGGNLLKSVAFKVE